MISPNVTIFAIFVFVLIIDSTDFFVCEDKVSYFFRVLQIFKTIYGKKLTETISDTIFSITFCIYKNYSYLCNKN